MRASLGLFIQGVTVVSSKLEMELKGVSLVVMMILLITGSAMADCPEGLEQCLKTTCPRPPVISCVQQCLVKCPPVQTEGHLRHHHHCKSGCSHYCHKYHDDEKKIAKCMQHCETNCIIRAPSPSPSFQ
uniref:uncharacterized protein LOC105351424 n=1 Tax=Fragaria vesca subsp. vesca TaxID=101020 RepID=UPI0005C8B52F|nr:PREDICTED: uncharacterized protein LOC105351424 [Fragaria vesca subsp. vesca]